MNFLQSLVILLLQEWSKCKILSWSFLKQWKETIQERIYESDQWCLIGMTLTLWPKCSLMHVGKKIWFSGGLVEIIRWFCNMILMSNKITLVDSSLWSLSILTKNIVGRPIGQWTGVLVNLAFFLAIKEQVWRQRAELFYGELCLV